MTFAPSVVITNAALDVIRIAGAAALPRETGGILAGFRTEDQVVVTRALVVPDDASSRRDYTLRTAPASRELEQLTVSTVPVVGYVGDWHTHPADSPPSRLDITSLERIASASSDLVALIVLTFRQGDPQAPHARVGRRTSHNVVGRRRATTWPAPITTTKANAEYLERSANGTTYAPEGAGNP